MGDVELTDIPATATPDGSPAAAQGAGETPTATGNGAVVVSGQFPAGTVVKCYHVDSEATLRVDADATLVGERMSDDNGDVGFPGLEQGARYFVCGYVDGTLLEIRCVGQDPEAPNAPLGQPPVQPLPTTIGTQQEKVEPVAPAPPADSIPVGIDPAAQPAALDESPNLSDEYFLHSGDGEIDTSVWPVASVRVPAEIDPANMGSDVPPTTLYTYAGDDLTAPLPDGWSVYTGPTESVPAAEPPVAAVPQETAAEGAAREAHEAGEAAASAPPVNAPNPPAPDAGTPDASESSGTGQANGGAIEEPIAQTPPEAVTTTIVPDGDAASTVQEPEASSLVDAAPPVPSVEAQPVQTPPAVDPSAQAPAGVGQPTSAPADQPSPVASAPADASPASAVESAPAAAAAPVDAPAAPEVDQPAADPAAAPAAAADPAPDAPASS